MLLSTPSDGEVRGKNVDCVYMGKDKSCKKWLLLPAEAGFSKTEYFLCWLHSFSNYTALCLPLLQAGWVFTEFSHCNRKAELQKKLMTTSSKLSVTLCRIIES